MTNAEKNRAICDLLGWEKLSPIYNHEFKGQFQCQPFPMEGDTVTTTIEERYPDPYHDTALAVRALEEYSKKTDLLVKLSFWCETWTAQIGDNHVELGDDLPAAICDAILVDAGITKGDTGRE